MATDQQSVPPDTAITTTTTTTPVAEEPLTLAERARILAQLDDVFDRAERAHDHLEAQSEQWPDELEVVLHRHLANGAHRRILAIDGLMGVGKSTLCRDLLGHLRKQRPQQTHRLVRETVLNELLEMFYADPEDMVRHRPAGPVSFCRFLRSRKSQAERFQIVQCSLCLSAARLALIESGHARNPGTVLLDRSPLGNLSFALVHYLAGRIPAAGFRAYKAKLASGGFVCMPRTVHLHAPVAAVAQRIQQRLQEEDPDRECESGVPIEYLRRLDAVMLLVSAYAAARGQSDVQFVDWTHYGTAESVLELCNATTPADQSKRPTRPSLESVRKAATHEALLRIVGLSSPSPCSIPTTSNTPAPIVLDATEATSAVRVPS